MKKSCKTIQERIDHYVKKTPTCWIWTGALSAKGYGSISPEKGQPRKLAHKVIYEFLIKKVPLKMQLDHLCRNRACVNPNHLEIVTNRVNVLRGIGISAQNARKTHCKRGHPLTGYNLMKTELQRRCRKCQLYTTHERRRKTRLKNIAL